MENSERHEKSQKSRQRQLSAGDKAALSLRPAELNAGEGQCGHNAAPLAEGSGP